jgi:hypothetical protein
MGICIAKVKAKLVTETLSVCIKRKLHIFSNPRITLIELHSSEMLAYEHIFFPEVFEMGKHEN